RFEELTESGGDIDRRRTFARNGQELDAAVGKSFADRLPRFAAIGAAAHVVFRAAPAGVDDLRIFRIDGERVCVLIGDAEALPRFTVIGAAIVEVRRRRVDDRRI